MAYDVFLSHNSDDKPFVEALATSLEREGISCFLDKWHLIPGAPWQPALEQALNDSVACAVFIGPSGIGPWQNEEMRAAITKRVDSDSEFRVIPVLLPKGNRGPKNHLPPFLIAATWVEFSTIDDKNAIHRLKSGIRGVPPGPEPGHAPFEGECPYRSLDPFEEEHARFFFGRDSQIDWMLEHFSARFGSPQESRFLGVVGASGSGKSSLVGAGLLPAISSGQSRTGKALQGSTEWPIVMFKPWTEPLKSLADALWNHDESTKDVVKDSQGFVDALREDERRLHALVGTALHGRDRTVRFVIVVNQFEEVFTQCPPEQELDRAAFIDNLLYAATVTGGRTIVILTMRADFYGMCCPYTNLANALSNEQELVPAMSDSELREAIERPGQLCGLELEPALVDALVRDMSHQPPGSLPLLQQALFMLWERRKGNRLTYDAYTSFGSIEGALNQHANEIFEKKLPDDDQRAVCQRILTTLVTPGDGTEDTCRRVARELLEAGEQVDQVLRILADNRLITISGNEPVTIEIAHEALIRGWKRLRGWLAVDRDFRRALFRLTDAAEEWKSKREDPSYLYQGTRLLQLEEWLESDAGKCKLIPLVEGFVQASIKRRDDENERRQREIDERERKKEEETAKREKQKRDRARLMRNALWASLTCLGIALGAAWFGFSQARTAEVAKQETENALVTSFYNTIATDDPDKPVPPAVAQALWDLSDLDLKYIEVRKKLLSKWFANGATSKNALQRGQAGLRAAIQGLDLDLASSMLSHSNSLYSMTSCDDPVDSAWFAAVVASVEDGRFSDAALIEVVRAILGRDRYSLGDEVSRLEAATVILLTVQSEATLQEEFDRALSSLRLNPARFDSRNHFDSGYQEARILRAISQTDRISQQALIRALPELLMFYGGRQIYYRRDRSLGWLREVDLIQSIIEEYSERISLCGLAGTLVADAIQTPQREDDWRWDVRGEICAKAIREHTCASSLPDLASNICAILVSQDRQRPWCRALVDTARELAEENTQINLVPLAECLTNSIEMAHDAGHKLAMALALAEVSKCMPPAEEKFFFEFSTQVVWECDIDYRIDLHNVFSPSTRTLESLSGYCYSEQTGHTNVHSRRIVGNQTGIPIKDMPFSIKYGYNMYPRIVHQTARSNGQGMFSFARLQEDMYSVGIAAEFPSPNGPVSHRVANRSIHIDPRDRRPSRLLFEFNPIQAPESGAAIVCGFVHSDKKNGGDAPNWHEKPGIPDVEIFFVGVQEEGALSLGRAVTGPDGRYSIELPGGANSRVMVDGQFASIESENRDLEHGLTTYWALVNKETLPQNVRYPTSLVCKDGHSDVPNDDRGTVELPQGKTLQLDFGYSQGPTRPTVGTDKDQRWIDDGILQLALPRSPLPPLPFSPTSEQFSALNPRSESETQPPVPPPPSTQLPPQPILERNEGTLPHQQALIPADIAHDLVFESLLDVLLDNAFVTTNSGWPRSSGKDAPDEVHSQALCLNFLDPSEWAAALVSTQAVHLCNDVNTPEKLTAARTKASDSLRHLKSSSYQFSNRLVRFVSALCPDVSETVRIHGFQRVVGSARYQNTPVSGNSLTDVSRSGSIPEDVEIALVQAFQRRALIKIAETIGNTLPGERSVWIAEQIWHRDPENTTLFATCIRNLDKAEWGFLAERLLDDCVSITDNETGHRKGLLLLASLATNAPATQVMIRKRLLYEILSHTETGGKHLETHIVRNVFADLCNRLPLADLVDILKWPTCDDAAQNIVLRAIERDPTVRETGTTFDDSIWKFVYYAPRFDNMDLKSSPVRPTWNHVLKEIVQARELLAE